MPAHPVTPTSRTRCCLACPGGENATPKSAVSQPSPSPTYGSMGRNLGCRSLDAVRSVRGSMKGRRALNTATNSIPATSSSSCSSSPTASATKQKWYDSLRSKTSHIPMPSSSASSSPTLKPRLFKTATNGAGEKVLAATTCEGDISPTVTAKSQRHAQAQTLRTPLPKLELPGLDSDLRRTTTFRACSEKVIQDIGKKYDSIPHGSIPKADASRDVFATSTERNLRRAEARITHNSQEQKITSAPKCDVHYPLVPSAASRTEHFADTAAALSNYCLNNLLCGNFEYSNVILWTLHTSITSPSKVQQSFTILPNYLKPDRNALGAAYQWAIIVFRNDSTPSRVSAAARQNEKALQAAVAKIVGMGYHVDVWTKSDNYSWREAKLRALGTGDVQGTDQSLFEKYQAMAGHGIPGFSSHEMQTMSEVSRIRDPTAELGGSGSVCSVMAMQNQAKAEDKSACGSDYESEFSGFLEHQEESILPAGSETEFMHYDDSHISGVSEDLDMATRLGGKTVA